MYNRGMEKIYFATGNLEKIQIAKTICQSTDIIIEPVSLDVDEIQGENPEIIVADKASRAFMLFGKPLVVSDDSWNIPALNGFPGPYMNFIHSWFTPKDFLRLMDGIENRTVILHQYLAYTDGKNTKIFNNNIPGVIINEVRGENKKSPNMSVIALDADKGKTIAEVFEQDEEAVVSRYESTRDVWHEFVDWYRLARN